MNKNMPTPPHSSEIEAAVLSCLILDNCYDEIDGIITSDDFYIKNNRIIFEKIQELAKYKNAYDIVMLIDALRDIISIEYLMVLTEILPNSKNLHHYVKTLKKLSQSRILLKEIRDVAILLYKPHSHIEDINKVFDTIDAKMTALFTDNNEITHISTTLHNVFDSFNEKNNKLCTGFSSMDVLLNGGLTPETLTIVAGRPSMGKTAFVLNIISNIARKNKTIAIFSLEMSKEELTKRILSITSNVKMNRNLLTTDDWQKLSASADELNNQNIYIDDSSFLNISELKSKCRKLKRQPHGLDIVIVDYIQLMHSNIDSREQQIADISRSLKHLAKELKVPVIAISQLNRGVESRADKRPMLSDLRESGAIEQDADIVMFLYRDEYYDKNSLNKGKAEVIIAKHRSGDVGSFMLNFIKEYTLFKEDV